MIHFRHEDSMIYVIVVVQGGVVQDIRCSSDDIVVEVLDWDNAKVGEPIELSAEARALLPLFDQKLVKIHNMELESGR